MYLVGFIMIMCIALLGVALLRKENSELQSFSIVNPNGGTVNCLACSLAAIKTVDSGILYGASPNSPVGNLQDIAESLSYKNSSKIAKLKGGYWTTKDIERWLDAVYPKPNDSAQHFIIAAIKGKNVQTSPDREAHALYAYRSVKKGRVQTTVMDPQNGSFKIDRQTYATLGVTMIDPEKLSRQVLSDFKIAPVLRKSQSRRPSV